MSYKCLLNFSRRNIWHKTTTTIQQILETPLMTPTTMLPLFHGSLCRWEMSMKHTKSSPKNTHTLLNSYWTRFFKSNRSKFLNFFFNKKTFQIIHHISIKCVCQFIIHIMINGTKANYTKSFDKRAPNVHCSKAID